MEHHFNCTQCGQCCRNLKLPLTVSEAMDWLASGHPVQIVCDAMPWLEEPQAQDLKAAHRRRRSFASMSGSMSARVSVILAANLAGRCPNLQDDMRCGIYERRPLVCRVYPAEINPLVELDPKRKACPSEAWAGNHPLFQRDGRVMDDRVREAAERSRDLDRRTVGIKRRLCAALNLHSAAVADEGFVVYSPAPEVLESQLARAIDASGEDPAKPQWDFVSNQHKTIAALARAGAVASLADGIGAEFEYLGFKAASSGAAT
jgi:Fe-S-cluster containining protein